MDGDRWELVRIDDAHWLIHDRRHPEPDRRHVAAVLAETDHEVDVVWMAPEIPLPTRYRTAASVIDDLARWSATRAPQSRPIEIPSVPPFSVRPRRRGAAGR